MYVLSIPGNLERKERKGYAAMRFNRDWLPTYLGSGHCPQFIPSNANRACAAMAAAMSTGTQHTR